MKRGLAGLIIFFGAMFFPPGADAAKPATQSGQVNVSAQVGDFIVNISGIASPKAKITLSDLSNQIMASSSADLAGAFAFLDVPVKKGLAGFCFETIDQKNLGKSIGCLGFAPIDKSQNFDNIFLPPTVGLENALIEPNTDATIHGYSMPGAAITVKVDNGKVFNLATDSTGFYEQIWGKVPKGTYKISTEGLYKLQNSLPPRYQATLLVQELAAAGVPEEVKKPPSDLLRLLFLLLLILIGLGLLVGVVIYVKKRWPNLFFIPFAFGKPRKMKFPLHMDWYLEFIAKN